MKSTLLKALTLATLLSFQFAQAESPLPCRFEVSCTEKGLYQFQLELEGELINCHLSFSQAKYSCGEYTVKNTQVGQVQIENTEFTCPIDETICD